MPVDTPAAAIQLRPQALKHLNQKQSFMLHKPRTFVSHTDNPRHNTRLAVQLLMPDNKHHRCDYDGPTPRFLDKLACAGRLDAESSGLLIFTQVDLDLDLMIDLIAWRGWRGCE